MCARAVRVAIEKIAGVDSARVSLNDGYADIALARQNAVTVEQVRTAIRKNGFTPRETRLRVRGTVARRDGRLWLEVAGSAEGFTLRVPPDLLPRVEEAEGRAIAVDGIVPVGEREGKEPWTLEVVRLEPEA